MANGFSWNPLNQFRLPQPPFDEPLRFRQHARAVRCPVVVMCKPQNHTLVQRSTLPGMFVVPAAAAKLKSIFAAFPAGGGRGRDAL